MEDRCRSAQVETDDISADGRTLEGWALRWDQPYKVTDDGREFFFEQWRYRALARTIAHRRNTFEVRLDHHDGDRVGLVEFSEWSDGLRFRSELEPDQESTIAEVRDGARNGVSVRFRALQVEALPERDGLRAEEIIQAKLRELSLTRTPQYADAGIDTIRHAAEAAAAGPSEAIKAAAAAVATYNNLRD